jgi:hypothetical protein
MQLFQYMDLPCAAMNYKVTIVCIKGVYGGFLIVYGGVWISDCRLQIADFY